MDNLNMGDFENLSLDSPDAFESEWLKWKVIHLNILKDKNKCYMLTAATESHSMQLIH